MAKGKKWTERELLILLNLYHKMSFGQFNAANPMIMGVAEKMERSPASVSMKLCNLASFDPMHQMRGVKGLKRASKLDEEMWRVFRENQSEMAPESEKLLRELYNVHDTTQLEVDTQKGIIKTRKIPEGETEKYVSSKMRRGQEYFRDVVLNNYGGECAVTGLDIRRLLVASHIVPWCIDEQQRLNIRNGICLSRIHDAAFDCGYITFDDKLRLVLSKQLKKRIDQHVVNENFAKYEGASLRLKEYSIEPDLRLLRRHREYVFIKN